MKRIRLAAIRADRIVPRAVSARPDQQLSTPQRRGDRREKQDIPAVLPTLRLCASAVTLRTTYGLMPVCLSASLHFSLSDFSFLSRQAFTRPLPTWTSPQYLRRSSLHSAAANFSAVAAWSNCAAAS